MKKNRGVFLSIIYLFVVAVSGCSGGTAATSQLIIFSDIHFNPFYDTSLFPALVVADASQWESIFATSTVTAPSTWGEDSNYPLLALALASIKANSASTSIAIFPGDIFVHHFETLFYSLYGSEDVTAMRAFMLKTGTFLASEVRSNLGNIPVMFSLGNNDAYEGDYKIEPNSQFLSDTAEPFYTNFLNGTADHTTYLSTYQTGGYYSAAPLGSDFLVIVLNSIFFSTKAASGTGPAAEAELNWFESTLATAAAAGQKVWVITHVPMGGNISATKDLIDGGGHLTTAEMMWVADYQTRFLNLLSTYANNIAMVFTGHTHMDEFRLPVGALELTPAISPIDGNNPAFKVFSYYTTSYAPLNYSSLNYDLATLPASFNNYYTFSSAYRTSSILDTSLEQVFPLLKTDATKKATYTGYYYSGHNASSPITTLNWPVYWCGIGEMVQQDFIDCVNGY